MAVIINVPCKIGLICFTNTTFTGASTFKPLSSTSLKTWLSCKVIRIYKPTPTNTNEATKGIRHAHSTKASAPKVALTAKNEPLANSKPMGAPNCGNVPNHARLPSGAFSVATKAAPPHSPPKPKPCPTRNTHNNKGAQMPMLS